MLKIEGAFTSYQSFFVKGSTLQDIKEKTSKSSLFLEHQSPFHPSEDLEENLTKWETCNKTINKDTGIREFDKVNSMQCNF